ncbi:hypothetical protein KQ302_03290 [Synechococcus sp. CS-602]|uniref:hypothetical protein n=1 Tax=Synechococcaceae TaxID=1890426 RepID=UPI0008FF5861|nr:MULTISPECIES: hypothetical protein [Synechococcaceae]MCT4364568.1 hypothetical protein [Candidatus Regnicoccus frigidus MAG-AL1]APD49009.1 hypothetical protein BM449_13130 [Synechococcus sp. SynAce01]MCT0201155.1 hypothetical protein [Synechococcus sp. CS-603]MCT0204142.1 hypothetical protein [Synechococcus sp. CS-602]MCT0245872.1 hypothetical protein [Synechococcus sp. CS-601]
MIIRALLLLLPLVAATTPSPQAQTFSADGCPLLVPRQDAVFQPKRLLPAQVARKNAGGCLSPSDAIYGADGCPRQLCPPQTRGIEL